MSKETLHNPKTIYVTEDRCTILSENTACSFGTSDAHIFDFETLIMTQKILSKIVYITIWKVVCSRLISAVYLATFKENAVTYLPCYVTYFIFYKWLYNSFDCYLFMLVKCCANPRIVSINKLLAETSSKIMIILLMKTNMHICIS